jgi:hypothetical protein
VANPAGKQRVEEEVLSAIMVQNIMGVEGLESLLKIAKVERRQATSALLN